jgi:hypothetical protein
MLSHLVSPVAHLLKKKPEAPAPGKGVSELLAALAETRARKVELERQERELVAATRARLREQQEALEGLRKRVRDSGIEPDEGQVVPAAPAPVPGDGAALGLGQPQVLSN